MRRFFRQYGRLVLALAAPMTVFSGYLQFTHVLRDVEIAKEIVGFYEQLL